MRFRGRALVVPALVPVMLVGAANAAPGRVPAIRYRHPPQAGVLTRAGHQHGRLVSATWATGHGSTCAGVSGDGPPDYARHGPTFAPGEAVTVRFQKPEPPVRVFVDAWRRIDADRFPVGPSRRLAHRLRPHRRDGAIVAWDVVFRPPDAGDVYLGVLAKWKSECGGLDDGSWSFTVTRSGG